MTAGQLQSAAPYIAAALAVVALALFVSSLRYFYKSRTDPYWRQRRSAGNRGGQMLVWSFFLLIISGGVCLFSGVAGLLIEQSTPTAVAAAATSTGTSDILLTTTDHPTLTSSPSSAPASPTVTATTTPSESATATEIELTTAAATITPTDTETLPTNTAAATHSATQAVTQAATQAATQPATPSATWTETATSSPTPVPPTDTPTWTASPTSTLTPTATSTPTPTDTPPSTLTSSPTPSATPVLSSLTITIPESSVTPSANARLTITALDTQLSADFHPVAPNTTFPAGFTRIYYFVTFSGMQSGVVWRRQLMQDNNILDENAYLWGLGEQGDSYFFFGQEGGFQPGTYRIRLFIGQSVQPVTDATFIVK